LVVERQSDDDDDDDEEINYCPPDSSSNNNNGNSNSGNGNLIPIFGGMSDNSKKLTAHATLAGLAFVLFFPAGAIAIRLATFPGIVWFHAAFQAFAYLVYIAAFGIGITMANDFDMVSSPPSLPPYPFPSSPFISVLQFV